MNSELILTMTLLVFILFKEWLHQRHVNKLIDKLMSRNYYDYTVSGVAADINKKQSEDVKTRQRLQTIEQDQLLQQELGSISLV